METTIEQGKDGTFIITTPLVETLTSADLQAHVTEAQNRITGFQYQIDNATAQIKEQQAIVDKYTALTTQVADILAQAVKPASEAEPAPVAPAEPTSVTAEVVLPTNP